MPPGSDSTEIAVLQTKLQSLREMMQAKLDQIEAQLERFQEALEKVVAVAVTKARYQEQVESISLAHRRLDTHERKLARYEQITRLLNIAWGIIGTIIVAILVALATGRAQIVWK